ncbi:hypothetical protein DFP81_104166 [Marinomonas pollencensis]|uniref:Uncharacterized protein n=1 Tax=Marinomonas pollencensis TaxID=491954 RepID=A0A3E0DN74_9GAMM|nr:hypothetical protein DFP81_104166 [Marinomonas pollencensis]
MPILLLLMTVAGLSVAYQQRLEARFLLRSTLQELNQNQQLWLAFEQAVVAPVVFAQASQSQCSGFCQLTTNAYANDSRNWHHEDATLTYIWRYYVDTEGDYFYRLCARYQQQDYCWWWQQARLTGRGFIQVVDASS